MRAKVTVYKKICFLLLSVLVSFSLLTGSPASEILSISVKDYQEYTRIIIQSESPLKEQVEKTGTFMIVRIHTERSFQVEKQGVSSSFIQSIGWSRGSDSLSVAFKAQHSDFHFDSFRVSDPPQLVIDIQQNTNDEGSGTSAGSRDTLKESNEGIRDLISAQEMKTVVIDPGHGGLETGAKGKFGTLEKDVTLGISQKLKAIIERSLTFRVVLTRDSDVDKSLEERAAIANNNRAYLFISIHANSSFRKNARGPETFFLNLNATDEEARRLAYQENNSAKISEITSMDEVDDIQMILWDMAQSAYLNQSSELAESIQRELNKLLSTRNRGIKQAPFKVLTGVACPAVLVEVAFISNPDEERLLNSENFQESLAQAIYQGLMNYYELHSEE
jgi:N-acetylmuramoyl-L-alanine amidase